MMSFWRQRKVDVYRLFLVKTNLFYRQNKS